MERSVRVTSCFGYRGVLICRFNALIFSLFNGFTLVRYMANAYSDVGGNGLLDRLFLVDAPSVRSPGSDVEGPARDDGPDRTPV